MSVFSRQSFYSVPPAILFCVSRLPAPPPPLFPPRSPFRIVSGAAAALPASRTYRNGGGHTVIIRCFPLTGHTRTVFATYFLRRLKPYSVRRPVLLRYPAFFGLIPLPKFSSNSSGSTASIGRVVRLLPGISFTFSMFSAFFRRLPRSDESR
jgi:hypothetical protein